LADKSRGGTGFGWPNSALNSSSAIQSEGYSETQIAFWKSPKIKMPPEGGIFLRYSAG
jgi:hypothetical protein